MGVEELVGWWEVRVDCWMGRDILVNRDWWNDWVMMDEWVRVKGWFELEGMVWLVSGDFLVG